MQHVTTTARPGQAYMLCKAIFMLSSLHMHLHLNMNYFPSELMPLNKDYERTLNHLLQLQRTTAAPKKKMKKNKNNYAMISLINIQ